MWRDLSSYWYRYLLCLPIPVQALPTASSWQQQQQQGSVVTFLTINVRAPLPNDNMHFWWLFFDVVPVLLLLRSAHGVQAGVLVSARKASMFTMVMAGVCWIGSNWAVSRTWRLHILWIFLKEGMLSSCLAWLESCLTNPSLVVDVDEKIVIFAIFNSYYRPSM